MKPVETLRMEKPVYGGDCLAHLPHAGDKPGKAVFVPLTLPGETVAVHIIEEKHRFAKAELSEILTASPQRVEPPCPYFGACGGCHYQHADYTTQLSLKRQVLREALTRAGVAIPPEIAILASDPWAYRNRIRLALTSDGRFGYRGRGSHEIVPVSECPIAAPILLLAAKRLADFWASNSSAVPVSEVELFTNHAESEVLITLFCESAPKIEIHAWLTSLYASLPAQVTGIRLQLADGGLNSAIVAASGKQSLSYTAAGFQYRVDQGAFFQVNRRLIDDFTALAVREMQGGTAWDLYSGVGLFARQCTATFQKVVAVESAPNSLAALQHNLAGTGAEAFPATTLDYLRRNRENRQPRPDFLILDPPRAGLGDEVTTLLNAISAPQMVYVSCDPTTLARDLRALTQERYRIESVILVDMFPQTFHIETVVRLSRS